MTNRTKRRSYDARQGIVDSIVATRVSSRAVSDDSHLERYLRQYFENVPYEDLAGRSEEIMARIAVEHLEFGAVRRRGQALLRIYNTTEKTHGYSSTFTFVEMVNDDMPFLVNSVSAAINRRGLAVQMTVHPIISVRRDSKGKLTGIIEADDDEAIRESFIRLAITREADEQELRKLRQEISKVLSDVRVAVRDWGKMRAAMRDTRDMLANGPKGADPLLRMESQALLDWMVDDHFTFLGYREYRVVRKGKRTFLEAIPDTGLGVLSHKSSVHGPVELTTVMQRLRRSRDWLILTKANSPLAHPCTSGAR